MILKGKEDKTLNIRINTRKAKDFEDMVCGEDESLLSLLPQKAMGKGSIEFMAKLLNHFQANDEKLSIDDCYDFMDDYFEANEKSIVDLYTEIIEQFDVAGVIAKGMGFHISKMIKEELKKMKEEMTSMEMSEENTTK